MTPVPVDFLPVPKDVFFAVMGPRNVHPRPERERSVWYDLDTRAELGVSMPGYANSFTPENGFTPKTFYLRKDLLP